MYLIYFIISIIIFINRCLLNEDYQEIFNTGYFYSLFCKDIEYKLLLNCNSNIIWFGYRKVYVALHEQIAIWI